jgi:DNA-binding response OmpR family regulator
MAMNALQEVIRGEHGAPPKILLMEDEVNVARGLKMVLNEEGYEVDVATTGQSALDQFHQKTFDLLVADLRLPDMDGLEVIKQVRGEQPDTEVVVITGYPSVATAVESMKSGAFDFLPKPFTEEEFKTVIESALHKMKGGTEAEATPGPVLSEAAELIQKREVMRVLTRTTEDKGFWRDLLEPGSEVLEEYQLSSEAKAAILFGDLMWLNDHVGGLTQKQLMFIYRRLEREAW